MTLDIGYKNDDRTELLNFSVKNNVPIILQSEVAECGLASLAMISSYHGAKINLTPLRKIYSIDNSGLTLRQLINIANDLDFSCRALKCPIEKIENLVLPCILHWDMKHFVVLTKIKKNTIYINDPALGRRKLSFDEFGESYTGVALELTKMSSFKKQDKREVISPSQLWSKMTGLKRALCALLFLSMLLQGLSILSPYYMQWVVDSVLLSNDLSLLKILAIGFSFVVVLQTLISTFRSWVTLRVSSALTLQMGSNLFNHLIKLPLSFFEKRHIGDVVSRFESMNNIKEILTTGLIESIIDGAMVIIVLIVMFIYSPMLTFIVLFSVIISYFVQTICYVPSRRISEELIISEAKEDSTFLESIRAIQAIKLFSNEGYRKNLWLNRYSDSINNNIRLEKINLLEESIVKLLFGIESIIVIYFGAKFVMNGDLTVGMLIAFVAYKTQFTTSANSFIDNIISFRLLGLHLERISDIALEERDSPDNFFELPQEYIENVFLEVNGVSFKYSDSSKYIFEDVSFNIKEGESIAIVGPSGCGKTTLAKLMLGLLKPAEGDVFLGGVALDNYSDHKRFFGAVMQNDTLLSGTISENIAFFEPEVDDNHLIQCCKVACIHDDISSLPMGYNSLVGDMGSIFSGGQLQRIFLARALYKKPKILILDESTSNLDGVTSGIVDDNIKRLNITRILIAHRKETIDSADRVVDLSSFFKGD
ncbi:peptidase domain-containing ABC transporter [Vibrio splendidus]